MAMRTEAAVKGRTAHLPLSPCSSPARGEGSSVRAIGAESGRPS